MGQFTLYNFIQDQWQKVKLVEHIDLTGKTVVVVGANVGLGFEAAKHFASMNPKRLVLGCRNQEKGQAAIQGKRTAPIGLVVSESVPGKPYRPPGLKVLSSGSSTSVNLHLFRHLQTLSFVIMLK
jgi:retinol dehydrogenase-12